MILPRVQDGGLEVVLGLEHGATQTLLRGESISQGGSACGLDLGQRYVS